MNIGVLAVAAVHAQPFDSDFYLAIATVAPIFLLALVVQLRVIDSKRIARMLRAAPKPLGIWFIAVSLYFVATVILAEGCALSALDYQSADGFVHYVCEQAV